MSHYEYEQLDGYDSNRSDGDEVTLRQLESSGSDMSLPTDFIHFLSFLTEDQMLTAGRTLRQTFGYEVKGFGPTDEQDEWSLHVTINRVPSIENIRKMRGVMTVAAERFGGNYEGWEAAVRSPAANSSDIA